MSSWKTSRRVYASIDGGARVHVHHCIRSEIHPTRIQMCTCMHARLLSPCTVSGLLECTCHLCVSLLLSSSASTGRLIFLPPFSLLFFCLPLLFSGVCLPTLLLFSSLCVFPPLFFLELRTKCASIAGHTARRSFVSYTSESRTNSRGFRCLRRLSQNGPYTNKGMHTVPYTERHA